VWILTFFVAGMFYRPSLVSLGYGAALLSLLMAGEPLGMMILEVTATAAVIAAVALIPTILIEAEAVVIRWRKQQPENQPAVVRLAREVEVLDVYGT